jgi:hypothetical protein
VEKGIKNYKTPDVTVSQVVITALRIREVSSSNLSQSICYLFLQVCFTKIIETLNTSKFDVKVVAVNLFSVASPHMGL